MRRMYQHIVSEHCKQFDQMVFLPGARQVGKTTIAHQVCDDVKNHLYLNWDYPSDRQFILSGSNNVIDAIENKRLGEHTKPIVVFDEIHKFKDWKNYLKGYFDYSKTQINTLVTGSGKLDVYQKGGDSLMGRYFIYRVHPLSTRELITPNYDAEKIHFPKKLDNNVWESLYEFGGFPDPLLKQDKRFSNRWQQLRMQQLLQEDINAFIHISELAQIEVLAKLLHQNASQQLNYHQLAKMIQVTDKTLKRWIECLKSLYFCFTIQPWSKNISRSLIKEPKLYLYDWSLIHDKGARIENLIACHLLKAVHYWTDIGLGNYQLYYLRDKEKREVDFLITENDKPWILAEVKASNNQSINPNLYYYQSQTQAPYAFQVAFDAPYIDEDCFSVKKPTIVPARTFLSQLV